MIRPFQHESTPGFHYDVAVCLGHLCAALVLQKNDVASECMRVAQESGLERETVREAILLSYLFDGYPTALEGMFLLNEVWPGEPHPVEPGNFNEWIEWRRRGEELYRRIYGDVADLLQERARGASPELARWMIIEGYGKVLSRAGLDIQTRELIIVAILTVKKRPRQLRSHLRGSVRVGVPADLVRKFIGSLEELAGPDACSQAIELLNNHHGK